MQGAKWRLVGQLCTSREGSRGSQVMERLDLHQGAIGCLQAWSEKNVVSLGSAVLIAPGIALASRHVFDEYNSQRLLNDPDGGLVLTAPRSGGIDVWVAKKLYYDPSLDIVVIEVEPRFSTDDGHDFHVFQPSMAIPNVGDQVTMLGLVPETGFGRLNDAASSVRMVLMATVGEVTQVFPIQRDSVMMPCPCFEALGFAPGGMSGGPVFASDGTMIGIVSTGVAPGESEPAVCTVSSLWPAMLKEVSPAWPSGFWPPSEKLFRQDRILCTNRELLSEVAIDKWHHRQIAF